MNMRYLIKNAKYEVRDGKRHTILSLEDEKGELYKTKFAGNYTNLIGAYLIKEDGRYFWEYPKKTNQVSKKPREKIGSVVVIGSSGKTTPFEVNVKVMPNKETKISPLSFVLVNYFDERKAVGQILNYYRNKNNEAFAGIRILGVPNGNKLDTTSIPFTVGSPVYIARNEDIISSLYMNEKTGLNLGYLSKTKIPVYVELSRLMSGHIAVISQIRYGKSYTVGKIVEQIMQKTSTPVVIFDSRGEYDFGVPNDQYEEVEKAKKIGIKPRSFNNYAHISFEKEEGKVYIPQYKLSKSKIYENIFSRPNFVSIVDLKSLDTFYDKVTVISTILKNMYSLRKNKRLVPTLLVIEEAEQYIPQDKKSNELKEVMKSISREAAQTGLSMVIVGHRIADIDKSALSSAHNFFFLHSEIDIDLKRISDIAGSKFYEPIVKSLPIGHALITGTSVERPIVVDVHPRQAKHFGKTETPNILIEGDKEVEKIGNLQKIVDSV